MIGDYIKKEETIILAVVPANVDIATTEALQMAKEVDREGGRTLGKVTILQNLIKLAYFGWSFSLS